MVNGNDDELSYFERTVCEAIKCVNRNVGDIVQRLVDSGLLQEHDAAAFHNGMAQCVAAVHDAEDRPYRAHLRPRQAEELSSYLTGWPVSSGHPAR